MPVPFSASVPFHQAVMPDEKAMEPKMLIERKKYLQVVNILKEFMGATTVTKHILDLKVNFTIGKLLASASAIEKQLTKAILEDGTV